MPLVKQIALELHVSRRARDFYRIDDAFFALDGRVIFPDYHAARQFAHKLNARRDLLRFPEQAVRAGEINAMGLIVEILHHVIALYRERIDSEVMQAASRHLAQELGQEELDEVLRRFLADFPPEAVYRRRIDAESYLAGQTDGVARRLLLLEELTMLWLENVNPAFAPLLDLFDDAELERTTAYRRLFPLLQRWFAARPPFGPDDESLLDMLQAPARAVPHSLAGQLEYIRERWGHLLGDRLYKLLSGLDLLREEQRRRGLGGGDSPVLSFSPGARAAWAADLVRYSPDRDWMPRLVLIAKSTYVWLDQLSRRLGRRLSRLDEIPDEELDRLSRWGFTGIWLIGLWERSRASQRIKQLCGNPEAVASAYSLHDYRIAADLGGEAAYDNLRRRAWERGLRLAGDMVPNHVGIDGRWVIEHPDWFICLPHPPFPAYRFEGPDLSSDGRVGIYIEDRYYTREDAAVVFKRVDRASGETRYIYHGNDGTSMPWNDTAQLDFLNPGCREAVIQTILHVARQFPVIRFDAAMTLAKRHYQRLWYPEPGAGGDIPSRAGQGLTRQQFDAAMPEEFWREVVERVAREAPDTLLLAEAFWLMEGYFVRTLGMHRVYNSAFMNMLKAEENAKYRQSLKNVLAFDPEILKRFVNFMNNPDEETAVAQFGKDDKYFGVCLLLATMPGLPMFGHGQIEGFAEKYGMEYRRAYWDEGPDPNLIARHEREIFPLLHRRWLFAEARDFLLYDFHGPDGAVDENVFAYSNRGADERAVVFYHNRYAATRGWIHLSVPFAAEGAQRAGGESRTLARRTLGEGLGLAADEDIYYVFRDQIGGLEYLRAGRQLCTEGLYVELGAYKSHAFVAWREVRDPDRRYANLAAYLNGRGVPSVDEAMRQTFLQPIHQAFAELAAAALACLEAPAPPASLPGQDAGARLDTASEAARRLAWRIAESTGAPADAQAYAEQVRRDLGRLASWRRTDLPDELAAHLAATPQATAVMALWVLVRELGRLGGGDPGWLPRGRSRLEEWLLGRALEAILRDRGLDEQASGRAVTAIGMMISQQLWCKHADASVLLPALLADEDVRILLSIHRYQDVLWFNREGCWETLGWLLAASMLAEDQEPVVREAGASDRLQAPAPQRDVLALLRAAAERAGYRAEAWLQEAISAAPSVRVDGQTPERPQDRRGDG